MRPLRDIIAYPAIRNGLLAGGFVLLTACAPSMSPTDQSPTSMEVDPIGSSPSTISSPSTESTPNDEIGDPGIGSGLWVPSWTSGLYVVDQSGNGEPSNSTIVPGCVNGGPTNFGDECRRWPVYRGVVQLTAGKVISIRFQVRRDAPIASRTGEFAVNSLIGGGLFWNQTLSISTIPGDFSNPACTLNTRRTPRLQTGSDHCPILRDQSIYYFNIRLNEPCENCVFVVQDNVPELD